MAQLSYREVKDLYDQLKEVGGTTATLPDWSSQLNKLTQSDAFSAGLEDSWLKRASVGIDRALEATGAPRFLGGLGASVGRVVGQEELGQKIGERSLRTVVDFAPMLIPGLGWGGAIGRGVGYLGSGLLSGAGAYEQTGSPVQGVGAAMTNLLMPGVANAAEGLVANRVGSFLAGQGAAAVFGEAAAATTAGIDPRTEYDFSPTAILLESTISQLPFTAVHLAGKALGVDEAIRIARQREFDAETKRLAESRPPVTKPAPPPEAVAWDETLLAREEAALAEIRGEKAKLKAQQNADDVDRIASLENREYVLMRSIVETTGGRDTLFGERVTSETEYVGLVGDVHYENPKTGYRIVRVADDPANIDASFQPGELVGYPGRTSPAAEADALTPGRSVFHVPRTAFNRHIDNRAVAQEAARTRFAEQNPELPEQPTSAGYERHLEQTADYREAHERLNAAQNGSIDDMRQAVRFYSGVRQKWGEEPLTDAEMVQLQAFHGAKTPMAGVIGQTLRKMKLFEEREKVMKEKRERPPVAEPKTEPAPVVKESEAVAAEPLPEHNPVVLQRERVAERVAMETYRDFVDADESVATDIARFVEDYGKGKSSVMNNRMKELWAAADEELSLQSRHDDLPSPAPMDQLRAGDNFLWDFVPYDAATNKLGKHTLPRTGVLKVSQFKNMAGEPTLSEAVIELGRLVAPEAFEGESVNVPMLFRVLRERGPVVKTEVYGQEGKVSEAKAELDRMTHEWLETLPQRQQTLIRNVAGVDDAGLSPLERSSYQRLPATVREKATRYVELFRQVASEPPDTSPRATSSYNQISPFDTKKYPVVRVDVVLPKATRKTKELVSSSGGIKLKASEEFEVDLWPPDNLHENLPNALGWAMVQFVPASLVRGRGEVLYHGKSSGTPGLPQRSRYGFISYARDRAVAETYANDKRGTKPEVHTGRLTTDKVWDYKKASDVQALEAAVKQEPELAHGWEEAHNLDVLDNLPRFLADIKQGDFTAIEGITAWLQQHYDAFTTFEHGENVHVFDPQKVTPADPNELVAFVGEQQSRWGQERQKQQKQLERAKADPMEGPDDIVELERSAAPPHPLLPLQHVLVLKAVIAEAAKRGVKKVVVSDGETAMMTEGHDKTADRITTLKPTDAAKKFVDDALGEVGAWKRTVGTDGNLVVEGLEGTPPDVIKDSNEPKQSGGMRLHYDTTLPSAMKRLTGDGGQVWDGGVHKNARIKQDGWADSVQSDENYWTREEAEQRQRQLGDDYIVEEIHDGSYNVIRDPVTIGKLVGSPVFRKPDGTGKTFTTETEAQAHAKILPKAATPWEVKSRTEGDKLIWYVDRAKENVAGRIYDISGAIAKMEQQGGFTLTNPARSPDASTAKPTQNPSAIAKTGADLVALLKADTSDIYGAFGLDAERYQAMLANVRVVDGPNRARHDGRFATISLDPALVDVAPTVRRRIIAHELAHALTLDALIREPNSPAVRELDVLRQRLYEELPDHLRARVNWAINNNWLSKTAAANAKVNTKELHDDPDQAAVIYAFLNLKEFAAQGFSSVSFQQYMKSRKSTGGGSWWTSFAFVVKRVLGVKTSLPDTAFGEFLSKTERIMDRGEFLASTRQYAEDWFMAKGVPDVERQVRRTQAVLLAAGQGVSRDVLMLDLLAMPTKSQETHRAGGKLVGLLQQRGSEFENATAVMDELGLGGTTIDAYDELVSEYVMGNKKVVEALDLLPTAASRYVFERARDTRDTLDALRAMTSPKVAKLVGLRDPKTLRQPVSEALKLVDSLLEVEADHERARATLARMSRIAPDAFFDSITDPSPAPPDEGQPVPSRGLWDAVGNAVQNAATPVGKFLRPMAQLARVDPLFGEWYSKALLLPGKIQQHISHSMEPLLRNLSGGPEAERSFRSRQAEFKKALRVLDDPRFRKAFDDLQWIYQRRGRDEGQGRTMPLSFDDPEVAGILNKLSESERKDLIDLDNKYTLMKMAHDATSLDIYHNILSSYLARLVMPGTNLRADKATQLASDFLLGLREDFSTPDGAARGNARIEATRQALSTAPDVFVNLLEAGQQAATAWKERKKFYDENPKWISAQRGGPYTFEYWKNGKKVFASANNMADAKERAQGAKVENFKKNEKFENAFEFDDDPTALIDKIKNYERNLFDRLRAVDPSMDQVIADAERRWSISAQAERDATAQSIRGDFTPRGRTLSRGAEELPWSENHIDWIHSSAAGWQKRLLKAQAETMLLDPTVQAAPETAAQIKQHVEQLLSKDPVVGRAIQQTTATWLLGFNVATQIANSTQTYMRGVTELIGLGLGPIEAVRSMNRSWSDLAQNVMKKEVFLKDESQFLSDALHDGQLNATITDDDAALREATSTDIKRAINKHRPKTWDQHAVSGLGAYSRASMKMFRAGEYANNKAMLLAAFRTIKRRDPSLSFEEAKRQAYLVNASVNDVGGRANRPLGLFSAKGDFGKSVAMTVGSLQSYTLGTISQLVRHLNAGLFRPAGLTPAQIAASRKAAVYMLGVQLAAAGTLGMPFVSGALALLEQFTGLEANKWLRESVASLFGDSAGAGNVLSDIALSGVPSMMGWDFQSRLSVGNVLPGVSEYNGFQPAQMLGAPFSVARSIAQGASKLVQGDLSGGYAFVPPAVKKLVELGLEGTDAKDWRNRQIADLSGVEIAGKVIGFNPKRVSDFNAASRIAERNRDVVRRREGEFYQRLAEETLRGNYGTARTALVERARQEPGYNPVEAARAVAEAAEDLTFPRDLRREDTARTGASRSRLLASFGVPLNPAGSVKEVDRMKFRAALLRKLGAPVRQQDLTLAAMMDRLSEQNPTATRSQLRAAAEVALRRTQNQTSLSQ